jgi:hypothetical protein
VVVQRVAGPKEYRATTRFGVASRQYGPYADAFSVSAGGRREALAVTRAAPPPAEVAPAATVATTITPTVPGSTAVLAPRSPTAAQAGVAGRFGTTDAGTQAPESVPRREIAITGFTATGQVGVRNIAVPALAGSGATQPTRQITLGTWTATGPPPP